MNIEKMDRKKELLVIKNVILAGKRDLVDCVIKKGKIFQFGKKIQIKAAEIIDGDKLLLLPGAVDAHVHFRTPGEEFKEDWRTGSMAAVRGGVSTVLDMPNNRPAITTRQLLKEKIALIERLAKINFGCYIAGTNDNFAEIEASMNIACGVKVYWGPTTGNLVMNDEKALRRLFKAALPKPIIIHAEDSKLITQNEKTYVKYQGLDIHTKVRPRKAVIKAVEKILEIARGTKAKIHLTHLSTKEEVTLVKQAKEDGLDLTCDVTPHHLAFTSYDVQKKPFFLKVNPPLRDREDIEALWRALDEGIIDMVASDHAPHLIGEKSRGNYWETPAGVPGVETFLSFFLNNEDRELKLSRIIEITSTVPARRFGFAFKGILRAGADADLVLWDRNSTTKIRNANMHSKCGWTPWHGQNFRGEIKKVFVGGKLTFEQQ